MNVGDLMTSEPTTLRKSDRLRDVAREMRLGGIRHIPIVDSKDKLVGLISQRDLLAAGVDPTRRIADAMRTDVKTVTAATPAHEAAYLLIRYSIGCLPVTDEDDRLVGIVTETDFVRVAYSLLGGRVPIDQLELEEKEAEQV